MAESGFSAYYSEKVLSVHHWNETLFSFTTTRTPALRFHNGHFVMIGLVVEGKPLVRAYSIASANHCEELEFLSIKVANGPLTSRLQHLQVGDDILIGKKPVGTLVITDLLPARRLYLLATGTGLAPYMAIIQDPETYERFEKVIVVHGVRLSSELAYRDFILEKLPQHPLLGDAVKAQLLYYPTVTREAYSHQGRLTDLMLSGRLFEDLGLPRMNREHDRAMICGSPSMLADTQKILEGFGLQASPSQGVAGDFVIERAFVER